MGEVTVPGTYTLSAFSTVFHALYRAGGVNNVGSLRDIRLVRNGETIEHLDVYEFIMQGKMNDDVRLQEGDVIIVSPYQSLVEIVGKVKRPMYYEMKPTETIGTLLRYAGGFTGDAYKKPSVLYARADANIRFSMWTKWIIRYSAWKTVMCLRWIPFSTVSRIV